MPLSRRRAFAALISALALCFAAAATAKPAHALLPSTPAPSLQSAFSSNPTALLNALTCPASTALSTTTSDIPGVGQVTDQLKNVLCALNILGYAYRTTYIPPGGGQPIVRYTRAIALVGTLIDVDGNGSPDFTGNVAPTPTVNGLQLTIGRLGWPLTNFPANGKVSVEAVFLNPLTPNTYLAIGEDGRHAGTAPNWKATVTIFGMSSTTTDLALLITGNGMPSKVGVMGEVFTGANPDAPTTVRRGNIAFSPGVGPVTTHVRLSQGRQQAIVTTPTPVRVDGQVSFIEGANQRDVDVTIDKLPTSTDVVHTSANGHENVTFNAAAPIGAVNATYRERQGTEIRTAAQLDATNVPRAITFDQVDGITTLDAPGSSFGSVEARYAKGGDVPAPGPGSDPYAAFHRVSSSQLTAGLRLNNLKSVAIDQTGPYAGRLIFSSPLGPLPFSAKDDVKGISLSGGLSSLPLDTEVVVDPDNGAVTFDGHGSGIDKIELSARKTGGTFFSKASRIDATIEGVPALETINFKQEDGSVKVAASEPPTTLSLLASSGDDAPAVDGSYAWFEDTTTRYRAFARISGLKGIAFSSTPVAGSFDTAAPQVLNLHAEAGGVTVDGKIDKLPSHVEFSVPDDRVHIENNGTIDHIQLQAKGLPASAKFKNAKVDIFGISPVLDVYLGIDPATRSAAIQARAFNCPPEDGPCNEPPDPPCDPQTEECEDPDPDPDPPPPPPPPPAPELFGVDAHGQGVELIVAHAWADDADLALHPDLPTNRSLALLQQDCPPEGCEPPPCNPNDDPECEEEPDPDPNPGPITPPPFPVPDTANAILYDAKTPGHEDLRARISNIKQAFFTKNAPLNGPDGFFNGTDDIDIEFTQPGDITLGIRKEDVHGTVKIPHVEGRQLPTKYGLEIGTRRHTVAHFTSENVGIPRAEIAMAVGKDVEGERKALISGSIDNIPTDANVCISKISGCGAWLPHSEQGGNSTKVISPEIDVRMTTNGPPVTSDDAMTINARVCLDEIGSNAWVPGSCLIDQVAKKYLDIKNLKVKNFGVGYKGEFVASKYQDNFGSDDAMAAYLDTDGILVDSLRYVKDGGKGVEFVKTGQPLTADDFFIAVNYSFSVRARVMFRSGGLSCPPSTGLFLLDRSADGSVDRYGLPFDDETNLWSLVKAVTGC